MKVLIACEFSGIVREAFRARGHDAWSCDILDAEDGSFFHHKGDIFVVLEALRKAGWIPDLMIAHPPCTFLCNSGVSWINRIPGRMDEVKKAAEFFKQLLSMNIDKICVENPIPHKYGELPKYTQVIQPWQFGEDASKRTCLWLKNLPPLVPTKIIKKDKYANQTPSGQNKLGPSPTRWMERSRTYHGIANAMAEQWG